MIKKFINHQSKTIGAGALVVAIFYGLNGLLALLRNGLLASRFGASTELDIYYAAFRIPDFVYAILVAGALSAAFIPLFAEKLNFSKDKAWALANNILSVFAVILSLGAFLAIILSPFLSKAISPGFDSQSQLAVSQLIKIMMIQPVLLGLSQIIGGILQNFKRFFVTSLAPIFYNLGIILGIIFLSPRFGLKGLAWGVVLGALFHFLIQLPTLKSLGFKFKFKPNFKSDGFKEVLKMMGPRVLSLVSVQINFLVVTIIASGLAVGSMAIFNFTNELQNLPQNIFAVSFALAAFPVLSSLANRKDEFVIKLKETISKVLFFIIPLSFFFFILKEEIVTLALGYGQFKGADIFLTSQTLAIFSTSIVAQGLLPLLVRSLFSLKDSLRPFLAGLVANIANIFLGIFLSKYFGVIGLAISFALASWLNLIVICIFLKKKLKKDFFGSEGLKSLIRILFGSIFFGLSVLGGKIIIGSGLILNNSFVDLVLKIALMGVLGLGGYIYSLKLIKAPEINFLSSFFKKS